MAYDLEEIAFYNVLVEIRKKATNTQLKTTYYIINAYLEENNEMLGLSQTIVAGYKLERYTPEQLYMLRDFIIGQLNRRGIYM